MLWPSSWWITTKSSPVISMHILMRRSWSWSTSQALAWQTTSRSCGLVKSERSQNVGGIGCEAERGEEAIAVLHHALGVGLLRLEQLGQVVAGAAARHAHQVVDVAPLLRPHVAEQVRRDRAVGRHDRRAVLLQQRAPRVRVQRVVERLDLRPQPIDLGRELVRRHVVAGPPQRAEILVAQLLRAFVAERRRSARSAASSAARSACQPRHASSSSAGLRLVAIVLLSALMSWQGLPGGQYLPRP